MRGVRRRGGVEERRPVHAGAHRRHRQGRDAAAVRDDGGARARAVPAPPAPGGRDAPRHEGRPGARARAGRGVSPWISPTPRAARLHPRDRRLDLNERQVRHGRHAVSPGAERLPAHRPRQVDLPQLRHRRAVRRALPPPFRRHQPDQGRAGVHRLDRARRALARVRLGDAPLLRLRLLRADVRLGREADRRRARRTSATARRRRCGSGAARSPSPGARATTGSARPTRTSTCSAGCGRASSPTARARCGRRSTWRRRTSTCATR